jgi:hypothetical protein
MNERYFEIGEFDAEAISATLRAESRNLRDVAHGDGETLSLADGKAELEIYPGAGVARVTTADARVEIYRVPGYSLNADVGRVVFEQGADDQRTRLLVQHNGRISFHPVLRAAQSPTTGEPPKNDDQLPLDVSSAAETTIAPQEGCSSSLPRSESTETEQVQLRGRLGNDPWFTSGEASEVIGGFPLAVNVEGRAGTVWHKVVTFGETAEQLREARRTGQIRKGRLVDVIGQHVTRDEQTETGRTRIIREFHATSVTRVTATKPQPRRT